MRARQTKVMVTAAVVIAGLLLTGCGTQDTTKKTGKAVRATVVDDTGKKITITKAPERIVSLTPANTEILFALGLGDKTVGVTTYCDYPATATKKQKIGDFMNPNIEMILSLKPDLVLATTGVQKGLVDALEKLGTNVYVSEPKDINGVISNITEIGKITGRDDAAQTVTNKMRVDLEEVKERAKDVKTKPRVFYEVAYDPLYTGGKGTFVDNIVTIAGGINIAGSAGNGYIMYNLEELIRQNPDVYLVVKGSMNDPGQLAARPGYSGLSAVKSNRVYFMDDNLVSRPGPRITKGLKKIAEIIHPTAGN